MLNLADETAVRAAFDAIQENAIADAREGTAPAGAFDGVTVQPMIGSRATS